MIDRDAGRSSPAGHGPSSVYVGLMSGTSLDGIAAAVARFTPGDHARIACELLGYVNRPYAAEQRARLQAALVGGSAREYCMLGFELGNWLADAAVQVIAESGVARGEIRAIGSHGQTLWHQPPHSTWQLGEAAVIAERLGIDVVSDFRVRDVAAGGQGAPLVPIADALLFSGDGWRALQNIGGIGNVTIVPPNGSIDGVRAFDTGPGVTVIDAVTRHFFSERAFDRDGELAAQGSPIAAVVEELLQHPYFAAEPPKSTGRELFDAAYVENLINRCGLVNATATPEDIIATATLLTARSIADAYGRFMPEPVTDLLVSGGGANNKTLMRLLASAVSPLSVRGFDAVFFDGDAKEAVAFALLAYLHVERRPANVPRATGARGLRLLGKLTPA